MFVINILQFCIVIKYRYDMLSIADYFSLIAIRSIANQKNFAKLMC